MPRPKDHVVTLSAGDRMKLSRVIALACTKPPAGYDRWSLRLLEKHVLLTDGPPPLDHSTIGRVLKKGASSSSEEVLDDPAARQRRVRGPDGGRAGGLPPPAGSGGAGGVY